MKFFALVCHLLLACCAILVSPPVSAQTPDVGVASLEITALPGMSHVPLTLPVSYSSKPASYSTVTVSSDSSWVSGSIDGTTGNLLLSFNTGSLINRNYTATVTVQSAGVSDQVFVKAWVSALNIVTLLDDPTRSRTYGIHQDGLNLGSLVLFDPIKGTYLGNLTLGLKPCDLAISKDGKEILVINSVGKSISVVDATALAVKETLSLPSYTDWSSNEASANIELGANDIIYYSDGAWAPNLYVLKRSTMKVLQTLVTTNSNYSGYGYGDIGVTPDNTTLYAWLQIGWSAGMSNSKLVRYAIQSDGTLSGETLYGVSTDRDPLNTPVLVSSNNDSALIKKYLVSKTSTEVSRTLSSPAFSIAPGAEFAATATAIYDLSNGNKLADLPASSSVQAITSDYARLVYFETSTKSLKTVNLVDVLQSSFGKLSFIPADKAVVVSPSLLSWAPVPGIDQYQVYLGTSSAAVAAATPSSPEYLGSTKTPSLSVGSTLISGTVYYWRVDGVTPNETSKGQVQSFTVSSIGLSASSFSAQTVKGDASYSLTLQLSSTTAGLTWQASSTDPWIRLSAASGSTPATLLIKLDTSSLAESATHSGQVKITTPDGVLTVPISLTVDPLALTVIRSDKNSSMVYAVSEFSSEGTTKAYLLAIDSLTKAITQVVRCGTGVTDIAVHNPENRIYVTNWKIGSLLAFNLNTLVLEQTYGFSGYQGTGYTNGDVYRISAGSKGRLMVEEMDQWVDIFLYDTTSGKSLSTAYVREGGGQYSSDLRYYYHGENNSSGAKLLKYDTIGDTLALLTSVRVEYAGYYGSRTVTLSEDGKRVFWCGGIFDENLTEIWHTSDIINSCSADGMYACSDTAVYDTVAKAKVFSLPAKTTVTAINSKSGNLVLQTAQGLKFYKLGAQSMSAPVLTVAKTNGVNVTLTWVDDYLKNSYTVQYRKVGDAQWLDANSGVPADSVSYIPSNLAEKTSYEFRIKADAGSGSSAWSNVATATTTLTVPFLSYFSLYAYDAESVSMSWSVSSNADSVVIERRTSASSPWLVVATVKASPSSYLDKGLAGNTSYTYRIKALRETVESEYSTPYSTTTPTPVAVAIHTKPSEVQYTEGDSGYLSVYATGNPVPTYAWYKDDVLLPAFTSSNINFSRLTAADSGLYKVVVTNQLGSQSVTFKVTVVGLPIRITNLSVLTEVGPNNMLTGGMIVSGGSKYVLVRGLGPLLQTVGVGNYLADPAMMVFRQGESFAWTMNNDWLSGSYSNSVYQASRQYTGLPLPTTATKDSAQLISVSQDRSCSVQVQSADGSKGLALLEFYDLDGTAGQARFVNISTLGQAGGGSEFSAGFYLAGSGTKKMLIRAVGPTLASYGVASPLAKPTITLSRVTGVSGVVAKNEGWSTAANKAEIIAASQAAGIGLVLSEGSKDAVVLVNLPEGGYSAQVSSADGSKGAVMIEIYEVP